MPYHAESKHITERAIFLFGPLANIKIPTHPTPSPSREIKIPPPPLPLRLLNLLPGLHTHIKDRTIPRTTDNLIMHTPLTALALRPQPPETDLELVNLGQRLGVQLADAGTAVLAHGAVLLAGLDERLLAAHARQRLGRELHQPAERGRRD